MPNKHTIDKLYEVVEASKTMRSAALSLGITEQYLYRLTRKYGIIRWRQKNRDHVDLKKTTSICKECGEIFVKIANNNPGTFCSKKCQGAFLGRNYGFKKKIS